MKKLQMVDLISQYDRMKEEIDSAVLNVIKSSAFINGPEVKEFQKELEEYLNVKHVIPCGNGTDALQIALMALGLKPGDEVITASFTFIATAEVISLLGLIPVLVEVDENTFTITPEAIENAITEKTKAIIPVHLFGQCANMDAVMEIATKNNIAVIEDTAQAIGATYSGESVSGKAGTIGTIGTTSFFPSKNLGAYGDGGAIFTNDDEIALKIRQIANHGQSKRYYHDQVGVNSRLDSIQAAVLRVKLRYLDDYNNRRIEAANYYKEAFAEISEIQAPILEKNTDHVYHQYTLVLNEAINRDELVNSMSEKEIPCMVYYPVPLHLQKAYEVYGYKEGDLPVTEMLSKRVFSLPIHTEMEIEQLETITNAVKQFVEEYKISNI